MHWVTKAVHEKHIYKEYIGVDACAVNLMRPAMYGAYHHITVMGKEDQPKDHVYDVLVVFAKIMINLQLTENFQRLTWEISFIFMTREHMASQWDITTTEDFVQQNYY